MMCHRIHTRSLLTALWYSVDDDDDDDDGGGFLTVRHLLYLLLLFELVPKTFAHIIFADKAFSEQNIPLLKYLQSTRPQVKASLSQLVTESSRAQG